jgi:hypothetical protein
LEPAADGDGSAAGATSGGGSGAADEGASPAGGRE